MRAWRTIGSSRVHWRAEWLKKAGLDLSGIQGSGPRGRIVKADIEAALSGAPALATAEPAAVPPSAPAPVSQAIAGGNVVPHSNMRKVIARRLLEAKQTVPHFYLTVDCEIDRLLTMRKELNDRDGADYKISVNDFVIRASALALRKVSDANASWSEDGMVHHGTVDVSVAVAIDAGLITPIIRNADHKGLAEISEEMKGLAARARDGKLTPEEYQGGTFSISNLGMYGIREFSAIINPPRGCDSGGRRRRAEASSEGWGACRRNGDELHAFVRPPCRRWSLGSQTFGGLQGLH